MGLTGLGGCFSFAFASNYRLALFATLAHYILWDYYAINRCIGRDRSSLSRYISAKNIADIREIALHETIARYSEPCAGSK